MKGREMSKKMRGSLLVTGFLGLLASLFSYASPIHADDTDLFTIAVRPNVLIVLDNFLRVNPRLCRGTHSV
jgi:hypothetical protein